MKTTRPASPTTALMTMAMIITAIAATGCAGLGDATRMDPAADPDGALAALVSGGSGAIPGLAVSVIRDGEVVYRAVAGVRKAGSPEPIEASDAFHLGSDTKAMTALVCGMLVDRGLLSWDATVGDGFGRDYPMRDEYRGVTLAQLLSHTAGLPEALPGPVWMSFFPYDSAAGRDRARMAAESLALEPALKPGSAFLYSNLGYVVAGRMAELAAGEDWETLVREWLFRPLGMAGAGFGPPAKAAPGPWGHDPSPIDPAFMYADNPAALGPAGTAHASLSDLERYVGLYLSRGKTSAGQVLISESSLDAVMTPRLSGYALGWAVIATTEGRRVLAHDGSNTMFYCSMAIFPDDGDAIIVLANRGDGPAGAAVGRLVSYLAERFLGGGE